MNLPCKVVEDLLPMYFDCLCSDETAVLVEAHLKNCPACSRILVQLQSEFELEQKPIDDMKPLVALRKKWQKNRWSNIGKGICIALAAVAAAVAVMLGTWYFRYGKLFYNMAETMKKTGAEDTSFVESDYSREVNGCRLDLRFPDVFTDNGYARVTKGENLELFVYPEVNNDYRWRLYVTDENGRGWFVYLKADLTPDFESHNTLLSAEKEKEKLSKLVATKQEEISAMLEAVTVLWGIDLLEYTD